MDMNSEARAIMNRWRNTVKNAERRILRFDERISLRLETLLDRTVTNREPLLQWSIRQAYYRAVDTYEFIDEDWRPIRVGDKWGGEGVSAFFKREITIPERMAGQRVYLRIYLGGDSLLKLDGVPYHGLDPFRNAVLLTESALPGETHQVDIESYVHWYTGTEHYNDFSAAELVTIDADIEAVYWDFVAVFKMLYMESIDSNLQAFLETSLWEALKVIPVHEPDPATFKQAVMAVRADFRKAVYESSHFKPNGLLHMVGHSHLDIVYQWPYHEYMRKIGRTHATMLRLMEQYPQFKFTQSSAKIYADIKDQFPDIYAQIKAYIKAGRWQPVGAFWLEPDCNLISGESYVRQILHGQRFWQEEFGFQSCVCWLPDVFGVTWTLPQILKRSGIDVMFTNKLYVWNDTNKWTQNTFWWEGPDGSQIMTIFPPGHFIGMVDPDHMDSYWRNYSEKESVGEMIYTYGWGDGGGGVDPEMLECATRYADFPGLPAMQFSNPEDALLSMAAKAENIDLPVWQDELYLEAHRGTYTTKGRLKKLNRQSEVLLRQVELLASLAWLQGCDYPAQQISDSWEVLLNTQFHDALPGTHITEVYTDLVDDYQKLRDIAEDVQESGAAALFGKNAGDHLLVFNPLLNPHHGIIALPAELLNGRSVADAQGQPFVQQITQILDGSAIALIAIDGSIPAVGYHVFTLTDANSAISQPEVSITSNVLENTFLKAAFNERGEIISLWDKVAERSVLLEGETGNLFQLYEDQPGKYDAWDIIASYVEHELPMVGETSFTIDEVGPLRSSFKLVRHFFGSRITQRISLVADSRELTFETEIDWHERQRLLKVGFPLAVQTRVATYDIAYGNMERPTHRNTSHDAARFEVSAHWWMDMSESGYGVALLNDCKYGHEANGHWMRLTLLKGSIAPDPVSDIEVHHFTYSLYPHEGGWRESGVMDAAARLNTPLYARRTVENIQSHSFMQCDAPNVSLEAIKRSEDGKSLIVRLVEQHNALTRAKLILDRNVISACYCDLMENFEGDAATEDATINVELKPYEVVTLAINLGEIIKT